MTSLQPLSPDTPVKWEIRLGTSVLSPGLIAALSIDEVKDPELLRALMAERERGFMLRQRARQILIAIVGVLILGLAITTIPFAVVWGLAALGGHSLRDVTLAASLSLFLLIGALYFLVMSGIAVTPRDQQMNPVAVEMFAFVALPLLMYAMASPATSAFVAAATRARPTLVQWLQYFSYAFLDSMTLGILEGAFGDYLELSSVSKLAGLSVVLVRAVMTAGAVALLIRVSQYLWTGTEEHVCTLRELRETLRRQRAKYEKASVVAHPVVDERSREIPVRDLLSVPSWDIFPDGRISPAAGDAGADSAEQPASTPPPSRQKQTMGDFWRQARAGFSFPASIGTWVVVGGLIFFLMRYVFMIPPPAARDSALQFSFLLALIVTVVRGKRRLRARGFEATS